MSVFTRELDVAKILDHVRSHPSSAVAGLFENWVLSGERPQREGKLGLRLAVRNGYVNFYVNGQSVAKLSASSRKLEIETHRKYQQNVHRGEAGTSDGRQYPKFAGSALDALSTGDVARWAKVAATYASAEKTFVDRLVVANSNVIDLEAALPGPTAPRMDLAVVFERGRDLVVGFWEAKCIDNGELRASTLHDAETLNGGPKVLRQARAYTTWLSDEAQRNHLKRAYQRTGQILRDLVDGLLGIDASRFGHLGRLDDRIRRLADELPDVIPTPGLVVGGYCPSTWLSRRANPDADKRKFDSNLRSYRIGQDSHEARVKAHFGNYVCFDTGGMHALPELVG